MTEASCECCGGTFVDEVALLVLEDAVIAYRDALIEKAESDSAAWADAYRQSAEALAAAEGASR